jgi:hypothetical protein
MPLSTYCLKIKISDGPDGLHGPIDKEVAIVITDALRAAFRLRQTAAARALANQPGRPGLRPASPGA